MDTMLWCLKMPMYPSLAKQAYDCAENSFNHRHDRETRLLPGRISPGSVIERAACIRLDMDGPAVFIGAQHRNRAACKLTGDLSWARPGLPAETSLEQLIAKIAPTTCRASIAAQLVTARSRSALLAKMPTERETPNASR